MAATEALTLIGLGLFKKVVVSSYLATQLVDPAYGAGAAAGPSCWSATYAYAVQIYADFSGYTDIAIGCALLLGIRCPPTSTRPTAAAVGARLLAPLAHDAVALAARLRLHPARRQPARPTVTYRNMMVTMLLGGLWHGADWKFVIWGGCTGPTWWASGPSAWWGDGPGPAVPRPAPTALRWLLTFNLVCLAWVFFRADSAATALEIIGRIATAAAGSATLVTGLALAIHRRRPRPPARAPPLRRRAAGPLLVPRSRPAGPGARRGPDADQRPRPRRRAPFIYFQF